MNLTPNLVRERGFEPLSAEAGWILSPVRLPVPPLSLIDYIFIRSGIVNGYYLLDLLRFDLHKVRQLTTIILLAQFLHRLLTFQDIRGRFQNPVNAAWHEERGFLYSRLWQTYLPLPP